MNAAPFLALPNFSIPFELITDVSGVVIGAVLSEKDHPIAYFRKKLNSRLQVTSEYVRELFVVTEAVKKF